MNASERSGLRHGAIFAKDTSEEVLSRLWEFDEIRGRINDAYTLAEHTAFVILDLDPDNYDREAAATFWESYDGDDVIDDDFVDGFIIGATEVAYVDFIDNFRRSLT